MSKSAKDILSKKQVKHVARLAMLNLTVKEIEKYQHQLSEVLEYMKKLKKLVLDKIEPLSHVTDLKNVFREDRIEPSLSQKEALSNAKKVIDGFFVVDAIFEE